ncbi:PDZ domain-containing protein [Aphelenchoides avenae]|nr:PDZ domain-containing protein [Aphelenchus avenae]
MPSREEVTIEIPMDQGDYLGAEVDVQLVVVRIQPGTLAQDKLQSGDRIVSVNDVKVRDKDHFFQLMRYAHPVARIAVVRKEITMDEPAPQLAAIDPPVPPRPGYTRHTVRVVWKQDGPKLGLGIKLVQSRVLISRCAPGSTAATYFQPGDCIVEIERKPIRNDKEHAKAELVRILREKGTAEVIVERPHSKDAKRWIEQALNRATVEGARTDIATRSSETPQCRTNGEDVPEERSRLIPQRRDGFVYKLIRLEWRQGGPRLGLGIKHFQNRVLVSRCDPGSLASEHLQLGDHIIDVDGKPVTHKDVCRDLLVKAIQTKHNATCIVEHAVTPAAKKWTLECLTHASSQQPSVICNSDVRAIAAKEYFRLPERRNQVSHALVTLVTDDAA